jgi:hypothetical protein
MAIALSTIADSISKISVTGLTIKDINDIPTMISQRDCPILIPDVDNFVGFNIESDTLDRSKWTVRYRLSYILLYAQVGAGRTNILEQFSGMIAKATAIVDAVIGSTSLSGAVDWDATVGDPLTIEWGGINYHACRVVIGAVEFVN